MGFAVLALVALAARFPVNLDAAPQYPATPQPDSLERIRAELGNTPAGGVKFDRPLQVPVVPTFKSSVEQRVYVLTLEEWLHKEFDLNVLQRQSAAWSSRCCGLDLSQLVKSLGKARQARKQRRIREQIGRELAMLEAGGKK